MFRAEVTKKNNIFYVQCTFFSFGDKPKLKRAYAPDLLATLCGQLPHLVRNFCSFTEESLTAASFEPREVGPLLL
jgi:hypothetical protein